MSKRIAIFILSLLLIPAIAQAQVGEQEVRFSPGGDLVTVSFKPITSATCTKWLNTSQWASDLHTATFTYRVAPSGVTVTLKTSTDSGTTTATTDTSTSTTGATLQRASTTANAIQICVSGLTGSVNMAAVYRGTSSTGSISSITPGTGATNLGKAIDSVAGATDVGVAALCIRDDALSTLTPAEGDWVPCRTNSTGAGWTAISNLVTDTADNTEFTEAPLGIGGKYDTNPADHDDNDKAVLLTDIKGRLLVVVQAGVAGGADAYSHISVGASEDEHAVKATPGTLYSITATNINAAVRYLKCENDTAGNTAPGTDTPELRIAIPGATTGAGFSTTFPVGYSFSNALTCWVVTGAADSDVAEVAANELMIFYTFK